MTPSWVCIILGHLTDANKFSSLELYIQKSRQPWSSAWTLVAFPYCQA